MNILIIGAGIAGSSTAIELCKAGFSVTMIDITAFPRFRPGESCHPGIEPLLKQLDVWSDIVKLAPIRYSSTYVSFKGEKRINFFSEDKGWQGFQFPREAFDNVLLSKAISMGTCFIPITKTCKFNSKANIIKSVQTDKGEFKFDFLIDATGSKSLSSIKLPLKREKYSKQIIANYSQIYTTKKPNEKLNSYFEVTDGYWGYISLVKPKTYSVTFSSLEEKTYNNIDFIKKFFTENYCEQLSRNFETSWKITTDNKFENLYLVGDSLMTFDPTSSKGILKSIMTGIYAAYILRQVRDGAIASSKGNQLYQNWAIDFFHRELSNIKKILPSAMVKKLFG